MEYVIVRGLNNGLLYYISEDGHLYVRKNSKNGKIYLTCYEETLTKKTAKANPTFKQCTSRTHIDLNTNMCYRNDTCHTNHSHHEITYRDLLSLNAMKNHCRFLATNFPFSSHKIPIKEFFLLEIAK